MAKKVFVTTSGLAHHRRVDRQTISNHLKRGKLEPQAWLARSGKLLPLFEAGQEEVSTYETQITVCQ
jgi:hypothetical protein